MQFNFFSLFANIFHRNSYSSEKWKTNPFTLSNHGARLTDDAFRPNRIVIIKKRHVILKSRERYPIKYGKMVVVVVQWVSDDRTHINGRERWTLFFLCHRRRRPSRTNETPRNSYYSCCVQLNLLRGEVKWIEFGCWCSILPQSASPHPSSHRPTRRDGIDMTWLPARANRGPPRSSWSSKPFPKLFAQSQQPVKSAHNSKPPRLLRSL